MINIYIIYIMYEYYTYKLKIGKYGKYIILLDKKGKIIVNIGINNELQELININNLNEIILDKLISIYSNKTKNKNLSNDIVKMLSETEEIEENL